MLDTAFFMTMGGLGVSLVGFGGLFSALHHDDGGMEPAVYRWRMREIVASSFLLAFLGFGVVVVHGFPTSSLLQRASSAPLRRWRVPSGRAQ